MSITKVSRGLLNTGVSDSSDATAITIDSSENVTISGDTFINRGTQTSGVIKLGGTTDGAFVDFDGSGLQLNTQRDPNTGTFVNTGKSHASIILKGDSTDSNIRFYTTSSNNTTATERMRIDSNGLIGIGTTAPVSNGGVNAGLIHLHGGSSDWAILHATTNTTGLASANGGLLGVISDDIYIWNYDSDGIIKFGTNSTTVGEFVANGDFYTNDGTVHSLSDKRIKKNITPLAEGLNLVKKLNPVNFEYCNTYTDDFNGIGTNDGQIHKGFIADEVQEVAPSYVKERTGIVLSKEVDDLKTLSMTAMIPMLVKAIQEQQEIIDDLKTRIEVLEA